MGFEIPTGTRLVSTINTVPWFGALTAVQAFSPQILPWSAVLPLASIRRSGSELHVTSSLNVAFEELECCYG